MAPKKCIMADQTPTCEFQFVNSTIETPGIPQDLAVRVMIRKQAMKKASAARRRDGNYGKHNLRQYPVFVVDENQSPEEQKATELGDSKLALDHTQISRRSIAKKAAERQRLLAKLTLTDALPPSLPGSEYELLRRRMDFDILDLSTMATLHVNRAARGALSSNPQHFPFQLRAHRQWSYLSFLPSRYGKIKYLSDATDCVVARARQIMSPSRNLEAVAISSYVKALDSLQKALDDPMERLKPEVLCAIEILAIYELLEPSGELAWIRHAAGAARLIQIRGTTSYNSEFEQALFMTHTGPIMTEALLNNEHCFLESDAWKTVFRSVIKEDALISDRSAIVVELMILKSNIPGLFHDVAEIIQNREAPNPFIIDGAIGRIRNVRMELRKWRTSYDLLLSSAPEISRGSAEYDRRCKTYGTYLSCVILLMRLLGAISASERAALEREALAHAKEMLALDVEARGASVGLCLFMAQTVGVSRATIATSEDWLMGEDVDSKEDPSRAEGGLIASWKFDQWNTILGRKKETWV